MMQKRRGGLHLAIYHCSVKIIGRSSGRSSVAAAAYRAGQKITNERDGITHDYTRKSGVAHSEIILPDHAPTKYQDRATLWNAVEKIERRCDAQTAREVEVALPIEFSLDENIQVVRDYIHENFVSKGMCADFSIHSNVLRAEGSMAHVQSGFCSQNPSKGNPHAHIMLTMRDISHDGFGKKNRDWNKIHSLEEWRENWAKVCNRELEQKGLQKIDHRSLEAQGLERVPTIHVGRSEIREAQNREIILFNERYAPQNVSLYMNELNEGYLIAKKQISEINSAERELGRIESRAADIRKRIEDLHRLNYELQQAKYERENMGAFQNKKQLDAKIELLENTYNHSRRYFSDSFGTDPVQAQNEIERLAREQYEISKSRNVQDAGHYSQKMCDFEMEYKRQRLLAEIRADGKEIFEHLERVDVKLNRITRDDYKEIAQGLRSSQISMLEREGYNREVTRSFYDFAR